MHLIIIIAVGIFGGQWLFTHWTEWRYARLQRRVNRFLNPTAADLRKYQKTTPVQATKPVPPPPAPPKPKAAPAAPRTPWGDRLVQYACDNPGGALYQAGGTVFFVTLLVRWAMGLPIN
jgi:hypothetical protein